MSTSASSSSIASRTNSSLLVRHLAEQVGEVVVFHFFQHADKTVKVETFMRRNCSSSGNLRASRQDARRHCFCNCRRETGRGAPRQQHQRGAYRRRAALPPHKVCAAKSLLHLPPVNKSITGRGFSTCRRKRTVDTSHPPLTSSDLCSRPTSLTDSPDAIDWSMISAPMRVSPARRRNG